MANRLNEKKRRKKLAKEICNSVPTLSVTKEMYIDWIHKAYPSILTFDGKFGGLDGCEEFCTKNNKIEFFDELSNKVFQYGQTDLYIFLYATYGEPKLKIEEYLKQINCGE